MTTSASGNLSLPATRRHDYFHIVSPTLSVPSDPQVAIPVGLLACQRNKIYLFSRIRLLITPPSGDPLIRELQTIIVSSILSQPVQNNGKKTKKSVIAPDLPSDPLLEIVLHDTVIFPEGGGQPTDTGTITTNDNGIRIWEVVQAKRYGGHAVHYVRVPDGNVDAAIAAFAPGKEVVVSLGQDGWARRYDHVCSHV